MWKFGLPPANTVGDKMENSWYPKMFESKISILCYGKCQVKSSETCFKQHFASNDIKFPKIFKNPAQSEQVINLADQTCLTLRIISGFLQVNINALNYLYTKFEEFSYSKKLTSNDFLFATSFWHLRWRVRLQALPTRRRRLANQNLNKPK